MKQVALCLLSVLLGTSCLMGEDRISFMALTGPAASVDGVGQPELYMCMWPAEIVLQVENSTQLAGYSNGFRIYSPDGAVWSNLSARFAESWPGSEVWADRMIQLFPAPGDEADTVAFGGFIITGSGLLPGFSDSAFVIEFNALAADNASGLHICIDSVTVFSPGVPWTWSAFGGPEVQPAWSGPECFALQVPFGCVGPTGDVNHSSEREIDLSDLTYLVNYLFLSGPPPLYYGEGNTDGDPGCTIDISDLTRLVNHLFVDYRPTADCRPECDYQRE